MDKNLDNNIVREIAAMQSKIDTYESFIRALYIMATQGKKISYPIASCFGLPRLLREMKELWRFVDHHKPIQEQ